jgi:hypothetical protein
MMTSGTVSKLIGTLLLLLSLTSPAAAYDFSLNVDGMTDGTGFYQTQVQSVYNDGNVSYNFTGQGSSASVSVVTNGTSSGFCHDVTSTHKCIEFKIPAGALGGVLAGSLSSYGTMGYVVQSTSQPILNLEWDQFFETGFDLHGLGKASLSLGVWDTIANRWQTLRTNWQCSGPYTATTCSTGLSRFVSYVQNDATGGHDGCTSTYLTWGISTGVWYHFHQQEDLTDPRHPIAKIWIKRFSDSTEVLVFNCTWVPPAGSTSNHNLQISHTSWFGGGSLDTAASTSYQLQANIHIYTTTSGTTTSGTTTSGTTTGGTTTSGTTTSGTTTSGTTTSGTTSGTTSRRTTSGGAGNKNGGYGKRN